MEKHLGLKEIFSDVVREVRDTKKEITLLGSYQKKINGSKIFRYSISEDKVYEVVIQYEPLLSYDVKSATWVKQPKKVVVEKNCVYVEALNMKNAVKRLLKADYICIT